MNVLARALLLGAATGARSVTGLAALTLTAPDRSSTQPDATLQRTWVKAAVVTAAVGELVGDKLPQAPSRLEPAGLGVRCAAGAACGVILARRDAASGRAVLGCALVSSAAAFGSARLGARWRSRAADTTSSDLLSAGLEDVTAIMLGRLGCVAD